MRKQLFEELFKLAEEHSPSKTKNGKCTYLEKAFTEKYGYSFAKETFVRYFSKYIEDKTVPYSPKAELLNQCAEFLGYNDYSDFVAKKKKEIQEKNGGKSDTPKGNGQQRGSIKQPKNNLPAILTKYKRVIIVNAITIILLVIFLATDAFSKNKDRWMAWKGVQYEEVNYSASQYYRGLLDPYNQQTLETFKKLENPDCDTRYFNINGNPILWYYKVGKGNLELYTAPGLHPTNGKTLKAITKHMIQTHICPNY